VLLARAAQELKRPPLSLSPEVERVLLEARWPGNIRELANALERAAILADGQEIRAEHLSVEPAPRSSPEGIQPLADLERAAILRALEAVKGNRRRAAELLGIGERTLYDRLKRYGVEPG
jgi:two-component system response regulator FlrC